MKDATTATANISAPCGMTNEMPNDAELQKAYARLDKHMCYFLWQDAWKKPTASAYVDQLLKEVPNAISDPLKGRLACVTGVTQAHRNGAYLDANGTLCMPRLPITSVGRGDIHHDQQAL